MTFGHGIGYECLGIAVGACRNDGIDRVYVTQDNPGGTHLLSEYTYPQERGDINSDGTVNIADVVFVLNIILGIGGEPSEFEYWAADCNGDDNINILDAVGIVNVILGLSECEP